MPQHCGSCECCKHMPGCHWFCNLLNKIGFECADKNRRCLIATLMVLYFIAVPLGITAVLGVFSNKDLFENFFWFKYEALSATPTGYQPATVYTNLYGVYVNCGQPQYCNATDPVSWDDYKHKPYASSQGRECADVALSMKIKIYIAMLVGTVLPAIEAFCQIRVPREKDRYVKCPKVIMFSVAAALNIYVTFEFPFNCSIEQPVGVETTFGPGYWCLVLVVWTNIPAAIIHLMIPAPDPDDMDSDEKAEVSTVTEAELEHPDKMVSSYV